MALVRAKVDVFLNEHGYRSKDDEFEYAGPANENLESIEKEPYYDLSREELKDELTKRSVRFNDSSTDDNLRGQLLANDKGTDAKKK